MSRCSAASSASRAMSSVLLLLSLLQLLFTSWFFLLYLFILRPTSAVLSWRLPALLSARISPRQVSRCSHSSTSSTLFWPFEGLPHRWMSTFPWSYSTVVKYQAPSPLQPPVRCTERHICWSVQWQTPPLQVVSNGAVFLQLYLTHIRNYSITVSVGPSNVYQGVYDNKIITK